MAKLVLGIGSSHSPMVNATAEEWARFAPREPTLKVLDRRGAPTTYDALLREANGRFDAHCNPAEFAKKHAAAQAALDRLAAEIDAARLDALVVIGDDQKELYLEDHLPALLVYTGKTIHHRPRPAKPEWVDWFATIQSRYYAATPIDYPVEDRLARHLVGTLVARDFDVSVAERLPRGEGEGHAFAFVHRRLMKRTVPVVPVFLNTYYPPNQPSPARCYALGQAIRAAVEAYPGDARVGVLGSGGLTHFAIDEEFDRRIIEAMRKKDAQALRNLPAAQLNSGSSEIRNWVALAGAVELLPMQWAEYVPAYRSPAGTGTGLCFALWR